MDFQSLKRRDLQSLCKLNNIPANTTNAAMADALASLPTVEGLDEFLAKPDSGSPERSGITSSDAPRTTATRTRCRTRTGAIEGTDTRKTPATRTTRKRATQETSIQKKMENDMQAEFEAELEQSEVIDNNVLPAGELKEISEEVSGVSVENEGQVVSESQTEAENEVQQVNDGHEVIDLDDCKQEDHFVNEVQEEATKKVDFHSLSRKDLQNLCKKNKIPANMTNAAMADALESLGTVEGLQEFLEGCDSQTPSSPLVSGITSSCARRSRTTMKITREEPRSSKLIAKSCRGSRRRIVEETEQEKNDVPETPAATSTQQEAAQDASALCEESIQETEESAVQWGNLSLETSEVSGVAEFNGDINNSLAQEAPLNESILKDESGKGNNYLLNVENLKEKTEMLSKTDDEKVVEEESLESLEEVTEAVANFAIQDEDLKFGSADSELENIAVQNSSHSKIQDGQLENLVSAPNSAAESNLEKLDVIHAEDQMSKEFVYESTTEADQVSAPDSAAESILEKLDIIHAEDQMSKEFVSESATEDDQVSLKITEDSKSENTKLEKVVTFTFDSAVPAHAEDEMSEKSDTELTEADKPSLETNVESEGSCTEDEISEISDSEAEEDEMSDFHVDITTDPAIECIEKDLFANQFDTESTIQVRSFAPTESKTPLVCKSLRKLKKMYKEKLQQEKALAKRMEKLSLDETEIPLANVGENLQEENDEAPVSQVMPGFNIANENDVEESEDDANDETESEDDSVVEQEDVLQETLVINADVETAKLCPVDILLDNEVVSEGAVLGDINVVSCPTQATPSKCSSITKKPLLNTPTKSSCKTPMSARKNCVLDVNKENINSISKTEPGKTKVSVTESGKILSAMSMGMLKREFNVLQKSDKKRPLQSRSDNQCLLSNP